MAIGVPTSLGSTSSTATGLTLVLTTTATAAVGSHIIVGVTKRANNLTGVTDSAGNTYAINQTSAGQVTGTCHIASAKVTAQLATGGTITATFSVTGVERLMAAVTVSGLDQTSWFDQTAISSGTVAAWTSGASPATTVADEIVFGVAGWGISGTGSTPGATYTELFDFINTNSRLTIIYKIVAATGAQTASGTWSNTGTGWSALVATYKGAAAVPNPPKPRVVQSVAMQRAANW